MRTFFFRRAIEEDRHRAQQPPSHDSARAIGSGTDVRSTRRSTRITPRWVIVFMIIFIILVLLFVILHLTGNGFGEHMHMSTIETGVHQL
jgi:hypothetical protein